VDNERIQHWMATGARPSDAVRELLERQGTLPATAHPLPSRDRGPLPPRRRQPLSQLWKWSPRRRPTPLRMGTRSPRPSLTR
jgi:hypothetical protein